MQLDRTTFLLLFILGALAYLTYLLSNGGDSSISPEVAGYELFYGARIGR